MQSSQNPCGTVTQEALSIPVIDWADFQDPPPPVDWLVEGLIPQHVAGDLFGPPNAGKSSLLYSLAAHIASGAEQWFTRPIQSGPVVVVGGEHSTREAHWRSAHRFVKDVSLAPGRLITIPTTPILKWHKGYSNDQTQEGWHFRKPMSNHPGGEAILQKIAEFRPVLVIMDTILAVAEGCNQMDNPQQYALSEFIQRRLVPMLDGCTILTVSHTNQASSSKEINSRLHYEARAGGNGTPGAFRWMAGLTRVRSEADCQNLGNILSPDDLITRKILAFGASKFNEVDPLWTYESPALFEMTQDGLLLMVASGEQVKAAQRAAAQNTVNDKAGPPKNAQGNANTGKANGYYAAKNGGGRYPGWEDY